MGYRVDFEDGQSVEFDTQPTPADIEEAHSHLKGMGAGTPSPNVPATPSNAAIGVSQIPGTIRPAVPDPADTAGFLGHLRAGGEAALNTGLGLAGTLTTGPLAAVTNLANTAVREGRLATPKELGEKFNEGADILGGALSGVTSPLGQEYTNKAGEVMNDLLPAMMHFQTSGGHIPTMEQIKAGMGKAPVEVPKAPEGSKLANLQKIDEAPQAAPVSSGGEGAFGRIANDLNTVDGDYSPLRTKPAMTDVAEQLSSIGDKQRQDAAQAAIEARQAELELAVKKQQSLEANASLRQKQEAASSISDSQKALVEEQKKQADLANEAKIADDSTRMGQATQPEMFEGPDHGYGPNPYDVGGDQHWVKDENGMPIRADLSMEAQNLQSPKQGDLWGNELLPKHEQEWNNRIIDFNSGIPLKAEHIKAIAEDFKQLMGFTKGLISNGFDTFMSASAKARDMLGNAWDGIKDNFKQAWEYAKDNSKWVNDFAHHASDMADTASELARSAVNYKYKMDKASTDFISKLLPEAGEAKSKFAVPESIDATKQKVMDSGAKDISPISKLGRNLQVGLQMAAQKNSLNPLLLAVQRHLDYATNVVNYQANRVINPLKKALMSLPKNDFVELNGLFTQEMFRGERYTTAELTKAGYNAKQIQAYNMLRAAFDKTLEIQNKGRAMLGKDPVSPKEAYFSSRWNGDWHMPITDKNGKLAWYVRTATEKEGKQALEYLRSKFGDELNLEDSKPQYRGNYRNPSAPADISGAYHDMMEMFQDNPQMSEAIKAGLEQLMTERGYSFAGQNKHFLQKGNVRGFKGDQPWLKESENAHRGMQSQIDYLNNAIRWSAFQEAIANSKKLLADKDIAGKMPNATQMAVHVLAHEAGINTNLTSAIENAAAEWAGRSRSNLYKGTSDVKTMMYLAQLGFNAAYSLAAISQYFVTGPMWHMVLRDQGFKTGIAGGAKTIGLALTDSAAGFLSHIAHETGLNETRVPMSDLGRRGMQWAEDSGLIVKSLLDETGGLGAHPALAPVNKLASMTIGLPEKLGRVNAFMGFLHHLDATGKFKGNDLALFQKAKEMTDLAMVSFASHDRPTAVANMGIAGQLGYVYKSYVFNTAHSMLAAGKMAGQGSIGPLMGMIAGYGLVAGLTNAPVVNELDGILTKSKELMAEYYPEEYVKHKLMDKDFKSWLVSSLPENAAVRMVLQNGALTAVTGADLGSHLSGQVLDFQHPLNNIPGSVVGQEAKEWGAVGGMAYHRNARAAWTALHANSPPLVKGLLENNVDAFKSGNNPNNQLMFNPSDLNAAKTMEHRRDQTDQAYRSMGLTSYKEAQDKRNIYRTNQDEANNNAATAKLSEHMKVGIADIDSPAGQKKLIEAAVAYKTLNPNANMSQVIRQAGIDINTTPMERKEMNMKSIRALQYYMRYQGQPK